MEWQDAVDQITEILDRFPSEDPDGMPCLAEWVVVAAYDDAADASLGALMTFSPVNQWRHRSIGLLQSASDSLRSDDDG